jgi:hypothetical protein
VVQTKEHIVTRVLEMTVSVKTVGLGVFSKMLNVKKSGVMMK